MESVLTAIAQVGFPIVACILLWKSLADEREDHKDEMKAVAEAVNNNTQALIRLSDKLSASGEEGKH